ncbi:MAG: DUF2254 domain-containing protein [Myxococcales bacterium]|nr:DUF2254 domain-containing protein [Myxococcales bacterium]
MEEPTGSGGPGGPGGAIEQRRPASPDPELADLNLLSAAVVPGDAQYKLPFRAWGTPIIAILTLASIVFAVALWMDIVTADSQREDPAFHDLVYSLLHQDTEAARNTLGGLGEVMAAVLGLALTVSSIIVQLAATRFTPHITVLFFRARTNLFILGFFVISAVFVVWVNFAVSDYVPRWGVLFSMVLMTMSLVLLFPYFNYVFDFLDPEKIVGRITADGLYACTPIKGRAGLDLDRRKQQAVEAVEHLANISLNAMQQKDKNIASSAVDALCKFGVLYGETKAGMLREWMKIPSWNRQSPDFVSLSNDAVDDLFTRGTWLEWKLLRQYQMLFNEGLTHIKDVCYLVAIDTRRLGQAAAKRGDLPTIDLAIKFFNTYMRSTINSKDIRTAYNILHQYRQLGEVVLEYSQHPELSTKDKEAALQERVVTIARHMRYYGGITFQRGMAFITEVVAYDIGALCEKAFAMDSRCHFELLEVFLKVDDTVVEGEKERGLRGVRIAQVKLATSYLMAGAEMLAFQIAEDLKDESPKLLRSVWSELQNVVDREFWEVQDRGTNFNYLSKAQKETLPRFFSYFEALASSPSPDEEGDGEGL